MPPSVPSALISRVAELAREGVAVVVATRNAALRPCIARAWGPELNPADGTARLCVEAPESSPTSEDLRLGSEIAVTLSRPSTYRSAQLKGCVAELEAPSDADLERVDAHLAAFAADIEQVGLSSRHAARMFNRAALRTVTVAVHELYDQTPGGSAGARL